MKILSCLTAFLVMQSSAYATSLKQSNLPDVVKELIQNQQKSCHDIEGTDGKAGIYKVGSSIKKISYTNHNLEYIIHFGEGEVCSSAASFSGGNGGFGFAVFSNYNNKWQKIYDGLVYDYKLVTPNSLNKPANIIIRIKGDPGFTTDEVELEWSVKSNSYIEKNTKKNIYKITS